MKIKELRDRYQLTRLQFAVRFGIPLRTVQSWELGDRVCPPWVFSMMEEILEVDARTGVLEGFRAGFQAGLRDGIRDRSNK